MISPTREHAHKLFASGKGCKSIARLMRLPLGTVKTWRVRDHWKRAEPPSTKGNEPPPTPKSAGQWMQSMFHSDAHFMRSDGTTACSEASNGVKILLGERWLPHDGCLKKCMRCLGHERGWS